MTGKEIRTWVIVGATSVIAKEFAHLVAAKGFSLVLIARDKAQLELMASDIQIRYKVSCEIVVFDLNMNCDPLLKTLQAYSEIDLFLAQAQMITNEDLSNEAIKEVIDINITHTAQIIRSYLLKQQNTHNLIYLSSVAAMRGRAKNSLYGASKAAIEIYLEGLQQSATKTQNITMVRLGFIDTKLTYGEKGIFYASPPLKCATACWEAIKNKKRLIYHPFFWRYIMAVVCSLPFFVFKKMRI